MNITLQLASSSGPLVQLTFVNNAAEPQYLAAPRIEPNALDGNYFQFEPQAAPFLGIQVKRAPYTANELIELHPSDSLTRTYDLGFLYDLTAGVPGRVRYRAMHPIGGVERLSLLESRWLTL